MQTEGLLTFFFPQMLSHCHNKLLLQVLVHRTANAPAPVHVHNKEGNLLRSTFVIVVESLGWTGGDASSFHVGLLEKNGRLGKGMDGGVNLF